MELVEKYTKMLDAFKNKGIGFNEKNERISVKEALTTADANILMPKVISTIMLEAAEPMYLASQFLQRVELKEGRSMEFINFGAIRAFDVPEGGEYPEQALDFDRWGAGSSEVKVGKVGLKVKITDEMISDSQWDVIGMHLRAAGRAMARKKEEKIFSEFSRHGHIVFDGDASDADLKPTGRGFDGTANDTLTAEDFIAMCTSIMAAGFTPTDVVMHPLCWALFAKNEFLMGLQGAAAFGGGIAGVTVDAISEPPLSTDNLGHIVNYGLPVQGLTLHFSPWVPFDEVNKKFDLYIIDRNNVGVLLVKEDMSTEQFDDPSRDIQTLKVKERYGVGILNGGYAIAVAKNVAFKKTWVIPERQFAEMARPADMTNATMDKI
jgi:hypothetical protein